jgi:hypothetical protein
MIPNVANCQQKPVELYLNKCSKLTSRDRVRLEKLLVSQPVKNFSTVYR